MSGFTAEELVRYSRHLVLPEVGEQGQTRLKEGSVLLVGAGGLGSPMALYLAAAGVGRIGLVEFDEIDESNLQRQILFGSADVGRPKLEVARERILNINPHVEVVLHPVRLTSENALEILRPYTVVADGSDNFATRYLVNDACVLSGKPDVYGSVFRFEGQVSVFHVAEGPCYRCLFPEPPAPGTVPSCAEGGVLGILPGVIGLIQATEVVKLLIGRGDPLVGRLLLYDALRMEFRTLRVERNPECPVCGEAPSIDRLIDYDAFCGSAQVPGVHVGPAPLTGATVERTAGQGLAAGAKAPMSTPPHTDHGFDLDHLEVSAAAVKRRLEHDPSLVLLDVREPFELQIARLGEAAHIPMGEIPARLEEIDPATPIVVFCHIGVRSYQVARYLRERGRPLAWSLAGGIDSWAREIEPGLRRY